LPYTFFLSAERRISDHRSFGGDADDWARGEDGVRPVGRDGPPFETEGMVFMLFPAVPAEAWGVDELYSPREGIVE
jgi:hypothetical protein